MANARQLKLGATVADERWFVELFKAEYLAETLRGHLGSPGPENRWAAAQSTEAAE